MWICTNQGFISVVAKDTDPLGWVTVRARRPDDIKVLFGRKATVMPFSDYRYHARIPVADLKTMLCRQVDRVGYSNFKDSCPDDLHDAYLNCWTALRRLQPSPAAPTTTDDKSQRRSKPKPKTGSKAWLALAEAHRPVFGFSKVGA